MLLISLYRENSYIHVYLIKYQENQPTKQKITIFIIIYNYI